VWKQPEDNWNITTLPRSILPHLENKNYTHSLPAPGNVFYKTIGSDERMLERFNDQQVSCMIIALQLQHS
jgi:sphingomyelin phosphodiesterase